MALIQKRPLTPGQRFHLQNKVDVADKRPERALSGGQISSGGRNCHGRMTIRRRGGGHKRLFREIDFNRSKLNIPAKVQAIEYDPNRTSLIALIAYADGVKSYIPAPNGLKVATPSSAQPRKWTSIQVTRRFCATLLLPPVSIAWSSPLVRAPLLRVRPELELS
jgi:ribosomal protein L2